jgi:hypothetical protein
MKTVLSAFESFSIFSFSYYIAIQVYRVIASDEKLDMMMLMKFVHRNRHLRAEQMYEKTQ